MLNLDPLRAVAEEWRRDASRFSQYGDERGAATCELHADELEAALQEWQLEALTVGEASKESGYSESHLRALLSEEKIPNVGRDGAPRIRRNDLPTKPKSASPKLSVVDEALELRSGR